MLRFDDTYVGRVVSMSEPLVLDWFVNESASFPTRS